MGFHFSPQMSNFGESPGRAGGLPKDNYEMETKQLTASELFKLTKNELIKEGFTNLTLISIERVWSYLEKYLQDKGINYFSLDHGIAFLKERYQITDLSNLSSARQRHLRAIQLLDDFQTHRTISIRKKTKKYKFAQGFEKFFFDFMISRKKEGISVRTLESYIIYLERFSDLFIQPRS